MQIFKNLKRRNNLGEYETLIDRDLTWYVRFFDHPKKGISINMGDHSIILETKLEVDTLIDRLKNMRKNFSEGSK